MKIHEYQAKELYRKYGIPVPKGIPCMSPEEAKTAAEQLIDETKDRADGENTGRDTEHGQDRAPFVVP